MRGDVWRAAATGQGMARGMAREWPGNGQGMAREWPGNGQGMAREWPGNGPGDGQARERQADPNIAPRR
jgi:predicted deacylase